MIKRNIVQLIDGLLYADLNLGPSVIRMVADYKLFTTQHSVEGDLNLSLINITMYIILRKDFFTIS